MTKQIVLYSYALDKEGRLVNIKDAKGMENIFVCPSCKLDMIRKCGEHNEWHFAHKNKACDYDVYLHKVAEQKIMDWFNNSEKVMIDIPIVSKCPKYDQCKWKDDDYCKKKDTRQYDLKEFFTDAEKEKSFVKGGEKYVADILLNNKRKKENPLFLEICVTHPCEQKKKESGIKIIEFIIKSESDIERIVSSTIRKSEQVHFYNFQTKESYSNISNFRKQFIKFVMKESKKAYIDYWLTCHNVMERKGIFEVTIDIIEPQKHYNEFGAFYDASMVIASQYFQFKSCVFCKYIGYSYSENISICNLYKKFGTHRNCRENNPEECPYYRKDNPRMIRLKKLFEVFKTDVWIKNS